MAYPLPGIKIFENTKPGNHEQKCYSCNKDLRKGDDLVVFSSSDGRYNRDTRFCGWNCFKQSFHRTIGADGMKALGLI